jgi:lipid-binding SYLF domain-containing protein
MSYDTVNMVMAGLVVAQAAHGFIRTGSKPALAMGILIGGFYAASGFITIGDKSSAWKGHALAALTSVALGGRMGHYYYK